jgi:murein DD-endopeptidase MepM/ murein hydrolase activator NlpD
VVQAGGLGVYGLTVTVDHGAQVRSRYSHIASLHPAVTTGAAVATGQPLGVEGSTGTSTGVAVDPTPHLGDAPSSEPHQRTAKAVRIAWSS